MAVIFCLISINAVPLPALPIDPKGVVVAGLGHSGDFAHQFHIAFSALVRGACIFSGQPFNCAVSHFKQDKLVMQTSDTRVPNCQGCLPFTTLPFDHCKKTPDVVDVGSLVDYPRRHCGQNPIIAQECFDDVVYIKHTSRAFVFRGTADAESAPGTVENVVALLAQMMDDPATSIKLVCQPPPACICPCRLSSISSSCSSPAEALLLRRGERAPRVGR